MKKLILMMALVAAMLLPQMAVADHDSSELWDLIHRVVVANSQQQ